MRLNRILSLASAAALAVMVSGAVFAAGTETKPAATPAKTTTHHTTTSTSHMVDINSATKGDLAKLPGIGDAYADKIIAGRPYKAKNELMQKKIIPESVYHKISGHIIAKQA